MNDLEFREQYKRLQTVHPHHFGTKEKADTVWEYVKDMDAKWFQTLVDRIVMAPDPRNHKCDIAEAVASERRNRKSLEFANSVCEAVKNWNQVSKDGLSKVLDKFGTNSLTDAIEKYRKGEL